MEGSNPLIPSFIVGISAGAEITDDCWYFRTAGPHDRSSSSSSVPTIAHSQIAQVELITPLPLTPFVR